MACTFHSARDDWKPSFNSLIGDLLPEHVEGLVAAGAEEAFDVDFKLTTYGTNDEAKRDLAGDVAALANTAGGVLVIGLGEDAQGRATSSPGVHVTDAEAVRMHQILGSYTAPMPALHIKKVVNQDEPQKNGYYILAVPASSMAPHAMLVNNSEGLRYPRRNGASIHCLTEPEVAAAYRQRDLRDLRAAPARHLSADEHLRV